MHHPGFATRSITIRGVLATNRTSWLGVFGSVCVMANCESGGQGRGSGSVSESDTVGITMTTTDASASEGSSDASGTSTGMGMGSSSDSVGDTTGDCADDLRCGNACCEAGHICVDDRCVIDCGGPDPCGVDQLCCGIDEICHVGQCVVPGGACDAAACATSITSDCAADEVCDAELRLCVPNLANAECSFAPTPGQFDPVPRFTWGRRAERPCSSGCQKEEMCVADMCEPTWTHIDPAADDLPDHYQCVMTPIVADLDADCVPEIVFSTYRDSSYTVDGILRAIRGDTGAKVWTLSDVAYRTDPSAHPAIGDLDGDGLPEVVTSGQGPNLIAVRGDGTPLWISQNHGNLLVKSGSPSIANFDGTEAPEIAFGRSVFDARGTLVWEALGGATGSNGGFGPLSCVADLDGDDRPELIAGATVYTFTGSVGIDFAGQPKWTGMPADGYCGIADFDGDALPEIVIVESSTIYVFNGETGLVLASIAIPGGGAGGAPNIADFDGDGVPDIGTAASDHYVVVQFDGVASMTQLWSASTKDASSQRTGSSVFDFDGDGRSEVIYGDEWYLRIYPGTEPDCASGAAMCDGLMTDAELLFSDINSSRTRTEYPVIADVDGDFKAEIVVSTNNESPQGNIGDAGIEVFEDRLDNWVATLPIWNQHTYHVTNVQANASIPLIESPSWATPATDPYNSYRRNTQGELKNLCAPDLVPADLMVDAAKCPDLSLSVKVQNLGCLGVGPGVNVAFYDRETGLLGIVQTVKAIPAGGAETVTLEVPNPGSPPYEVVAVVDDDGTGKGVLNECIEDNNTTAPFEACNPVR